MKTTLLSRDPRKWKSRKRRRVVNIAEFLCYLQVSITVNKLSEDRNSCSGLREYANLLWLRLPDVGSDWGLGEKQTGRADLDAAPLTTGARRSRKNVQFTMIKRFGMVGVKVITTNQHRKPISYHPLEGGEQYCSPAVHTPIGENPITAPQAAGSGTVPCLWL